MIKRLFGSTTESISEEEALEDDYRSMVKVFSETLADSELVPVIAKDLPRIIKNISFQNIPKYENINSQIPQLLFFLLKNFTKTKLNFENSKLEEDFQNVNLTSTDSMMNYLQKYISSEPNIHVLLNSFTQSLISYPWIFLKNVLKDQQINFTDFSWKIFLDTSLKSKLIITHFRTEKVKVLYQDDYVVFFKFSWKLILTFDYKEEEGKLELLTFQMRFDDILDFDEKVKPKNNFNEKFIRNLLVGIFNLFPIENVKYFKF